MKENEKEASILKYIKINSYEIDSHKNNIDLKFSNSKSKLFSKLLNSFSKKEQNKYFDIMSSDLINFQIMQENNDKPDINISNEISFKNILYNLLEKNLIEIIYIINPSYREERIKKLYNWYKGQIKLFQDIKYIDKKSYKDVNSIDDEEYFKKKLEQMIKDNEYITLETLLKEEKSHRTRGPFDKKLLHQYKRVELYNNPYFKKLNKKKIKNSENAKYSLKSPILNKNLSPQPSFKIIPVKDPSTFYSHYNGTNTYCLRKAYENNINEKAEGGEKERNFYSTMNHGKKYLSQDINNEIKFSYSFNRPPVDFNILSSEKIISENKNKLFAEKRTKEELIKKIEKYGIDRAQYKENILKKNELKNIINMYIKSKKLNINSFKKRKNQKAISLLLNKTNKNNFISNQKAFMLLIDKKDLTNNSTYNSNNPSPYKIISNLNSDESIINKRNNNISSPKKKPEKIYRVMKRHYTSGNLKLSKRLRRMGDKLIVNEVKNLNKETKEIIDKPNKDILYFNIKFKYEKDLIKNKLLKYKINSENDNSKTPTDIIYKLISDEPLFKQKLLNDKICNINAKLNDNKFNRESKAEEEESIYHNFCLSAYNWKNMNIINKNRNNFEKDVKILRHISPNSKNIGIKKLINENDSFNNYKDNYLNLRKTIGEWKKYEFEELMNSMYKNKDRDKDKDVVVNKNNNVKFKKEKILINAIINPNENNIFPEYFLPKTGGNLLSKVEINTMKKKKKKI